jgi:hypothetical protein
MSYQRESPDYTWLVQKIANEFPAEWELARKGPGRHRTDDFVRRFVWEAAKHDSRIGLNGKRGTDELSLDAVSYLNPSGPGGVEVIDIITGNHTAAWQDVTIPPVPEPGSKPELPDGVLGKYIAPINPGGNSGPVDPQNPPVGSRTHVDLASVLNPLYEKIDALQKQVDELKAQGPGEPPKLPNKIALRTAHGTFVTAEDGGTKMTHRENHPDSWQQYDFVVIE